MKKTPLYAAFDLHSCYSVLGSMDHEGNSQPRMRFPTEANILRAEVEALRKRRRPVYLTMEASSATRTRLRGLETTEKATGAGCRPWSARSFR